MKYTSIQEFFEKSFNNSRAGNATLTIDSFAKRLGMGTSSLKMILSGKRRPTLHQVLLLARAQRLTTAKISYIETLYLRENAKSTWEKSYYGQLLKTRAQEAKIETISTSQKTLLENSLAMPLLVDLMESKQSSIDERQLAKRFQTKEETIKDLIEKLRKEDVLKQSSDGRFHVAFDKLSHRYMQKKYLKDRVLEAAKKVEMEYDNPNTLFTTYTFSATEETLLRLQMELKSLMEKFMAEDLGQSSQSREVAQANFQVFPITRG